MRPLLSGAPLLWPAAVGKQSHTHQPASPGGRNTQVHVQGHNDKSRRLGHCTKDNVSHNNQCVCRAVAGQLGRTGTFDKTHEKTKCHPVFIHFVREHSGTNTKQCVYCRPSHGLRGVMIFVKTGRLKDRM